VFDGAKFFGNTRVNDALVANIVIGREDGTELAGGVAVDAERNLIYVAKYGYLLGCDPCRNVLVVLRGPDLDEATRTVLRVPEVVAEVPGIGLNYGGGRRDVALDLDRNLIYVAGELGFGLTDITVLDGFKIVDAQGQVTSNPAAAILGFIPIQMLGNLDIPITTSGFSSSEMAFNAVAGLLYVVTDDSRALFSEGFVSVINSDLVIKGNREFNRDSHPDEPATRVSLIATLPAGIDPEFIALDTTNNRVMVTNQSLGALSVLQGLTVRQKLQPPPP
jgi:DNA-binding beta-propeller fold protein YncE